MTNPSKLKCRDRLTLPLLSFVTALLLSLAIVPSTIAQQPGDLDPTFGVGGRVIDGAGYQLYDVAIQPDGKIVAVGIALGGSEGTQVVVARYSLDGAPDPTFGGTGRVFIDRYGLAIDVAIQADGKIVVPSRNNDGEVFGELLRLNSDGSLDTSFGTNGIVVGMFLPSVAATLPDGKLLIDQAANLLRFNANGSVDSSFNLCRPGVGVSVYQFNRIESVIQANGKILTVFTRGGSSGFGVFRCNADGGLDTGFGSGGVVETPMSMASAQSIAIQVDGKFVVAGQSRSNENSDWKPIIVRYNPNGSLDTGVGTGGILTAPSTGITYRIPPFADVVIQADGKIVASTTIGSAFALVRYDPNGSLDTTFGGGDGIATVDFINSDDFSNGMALDGQGRAVVVGRSNDGFALARILLGGKKAAFDFDGDGKADIAVRRPSDNNWYLLQTSAGYTVRTWGVAGDLIAPADFDGDGKADIAVFRPSDSTWYIFGTRRGIYTQAWGVAGDIPVPADYDGDGKDDVAIYRPSSGTWYIIGSHDGLIVINFGTAEDKPYPADYDGDGKADIVVRRPSDNNWYLLRTTAGYTVVAWGINGDRSAPADYDGDGKTDLAVFRPSDSTWYIFGSQRGIYTQTWGTVGDVPVAADFDGDGKADVAVFRPSNGTWYIIGSTAGFIFTNFGQDGDTAIPSSFNY